MTNRDRTFYEMGFTEGYKKGRMYFFEHIKKLAENSLKPPIIRVEKKEQIIK